MNKKGLTLTELIGVIVILSIIIALGIVSFTSVRNNILNKQYNNLITYLETKAANYADNTGELNVTVERLIETGYVSGDDSNSIINPQNNSNMNCYIFNSKYQDNNYIAKLAGDIGKNDDGKCNKYNIVKEIQICVKSNENDECSTNIKDWYNNNVTLGVIIGGNISPDTARIVWKANGDTKESKEYQTNVSLINKGLYTVDVYYDLMDNNEIIKHFEGTDTININIDFEKPKIIKTRIIDENTWTNHNKEIDVDFTDNNGSGISKVAIFSENYDCNNKRIVWENNTKNNYMSNLGLGTYNICIMDSAGNISDKEQIVIDKIDVKEPNCEIFINGTKVGEWYKTNPDINVIVIDDVDVNGQKSPIVAYGLSTTSDPFYNNITSTRQNIDTTEQIYYGYYKDEAGNEGICNASVKVDTTKPTIGTINQNAQNGDNGEVTISTTITDVTSKLAQYAITNSSDEPSNWNTINNNPENYNISKVINESGTYYIWAKDNVGNIEKKAINVTVKYKQITKVRYENADGSWGNYSVVDSKIVDYGSSYSWSKAKDATYQAASVTSYNVTGEKTNEVSIYRNKFTCYIQYRFQNADGSYGNYQVGTNSSLRYGETCSWSRAADATYKAASYSSTITSNISQSINVDRSYITVTVSSVTNGSIKSGETSSKQIVPGSSATFNLSANTYYTFKNVSVSCSSGSGSVNTSGVLTVSGATTNSSCSVTINSKYTCSIGDITTSGSSYICITSASSYSDVYCETTTYVCHGCGGCEDMTWSDYCDQFNGENQSSCHAASWIGNGCYGSRADTIEERTSCYPYTDYYCPSGWNNYSGSGSNLKCYRAATAP